MQGRGKLYRELNTEQVLFQPSSELPSPPTLKEAGFGKSEMLFVSDLDS